MEYIPDYNDLYARHEAEQEKIEDELPRCEYCGEPITDDYLYDLDGTLCCEECLDDLFRKPTDNYID